MLCATNTTGRWPTPAAVSLSMTSRTMSGRGSESLSQPEMGACVCVDGGGAVLGEGVGSMGWQVQKNGERLSMCDGCLWGVASEVRSK